MAFTVSSIVDSTVFGNKRIRVLKITADSAEANITSGLQDVDVAIAQPQLGQTMPALTPNANSTGTAANGTIGCSGTSNANIFRLIVIGS